jgi:hypothetical protein
MAVQTGSKDDQIEHLRAQNNKLLEFFFKDNIRGDVAEFLHVVQKADSIFGKILTEKCFSQLPESSLTLKIFQRSVEKVSPILQEYISVLSNHDKTSSLARILGNANLRRNIEQINSLYLLEISLLDEKHDIIRKEVENFNQTSANPKTVQKRASVVGLTAADYMVDPDARKLWETEFGGKV